MTVKKFFPILCIGALATTDLYAKLSADDYVEAAWMTTRFYGAQRSGEGPNWLLDGSNYTTSFTSDKFPSGTHSGKDLSGGWFDCGDHVMFGQPQSFASYVLALSLTTFTEGWRDLYHGDYTDYKASGDYTRLGGEANGLPDLLEELRYEADFWVKAAPDASTFVVVKGNGSEDHMRWVTPGKMSTLSKDLGGGIRDIKFNETDAYTPGMVAAMLAVMARMDPDTDRQAKYLQAAKNAYAYAKTKTGIYSAEGGFYQATWWDGRWQDGPFLAALELYRTTQENTYKTEATSWFNKIEFQKGSYTRLAYANAVPLSVVLGEAVLGLTPPSNTYVTTQKMLDAIYLNNKSNGIFQIETGGEGSFSTRTPAGGAFMLALYSKLNNVSTYNTDIYNNIDFLLGSNSNQLSYVAGYNRNGVTPPPSPHHRGYYGIEDEAIGDGSDACNDACLQGKVPTKNKQLGGIIAGAFNRSTHETKVAQWNINEVCVDLNAPLVGALGYIVSLEAPTGTPLPEYNPTISTLPVQQRGSIQISRQGNAYVFQSSAAQAYTVTIFDLNGKKQAHYQSQGEELRYTPSQAGIVQAVVQSQGNLKGYKLTGF